MLALAAGDIISLMAEGPQPALNPEPAPAKPGTGSVEGSKKYWWAAAIAVPVLVATINIVPSLLKKESPTTNIDAHSDSHDINFQQINIIEREYTRKTGQPLPADLRQQLEQAQQLIDQKQYDQGIPLLRTVAEKAPVPSVLTNLGNALALTGKSTEAQASFSQAAAADPSNPQATRGRQFLSKLSLNNTILTAAEIPIGKGVAAILPDGGTNFFKFTAPSGPRDHLRVRLQNRSTSLGLAVGVSNSDKSPVGGANGAQAADITYEFPATPGAIHYLQVSPYYSGGGAYTLIVEPTHSFDKFEPNDTILTAKDASTGVLIEANIMDGNDTDFYRFHASGAKTVIVVENRSTTLGIGLAVTDADKAPVGSANGAVAANVRYEFNSKPGNTYHLQISPYYSQSGNYAFTIR